MEGLGLSPEEKKHFFVPKIITLTQFLTDFTVQSQNEACKNSAKISKNSRSDQRGGRSHNRSPEYATALQFRKLQCHNTIFSPPPPKHTDTEMRCSLQIYHPSSQPH